MSFESNNNPCPCESGLEYPHCCGAFDRNQLNLLAKITNEGEIVGQIPPGLEQAIKSINLQPDLYPVRLNLLQDTVQFVKMSSYWYSESVFLDASRILGTCAIESSAQWLQNSTQDIPAKLSPIIFHTAFCGSTLMSNALNAIYQCLPVREPDILSNLLVYIRTAVPESEKSAWFQRVFRLLARRYEEDQIAVIKTNDYANGLISDVLIRLPEQPILFMYTPLTDFFAGCIKAESRVKWIIDRYKAVYYMAKEKLPALVAMSNPAHSIGEMIAVYWSYNVALYHNASKIDSAKLKSLNFNAMLQSPVEAVAACAKWFELKQQENIKPAEEMKWLLGVYSKDVTYDYSPQKRKADLQKILSENVDELLLAEKMARQLLDDRYPDDGLPHSLIP